ncbi:MAG TPA: ankyrin repeat domain-containing protein, partial [Burkholderiales bacterium]|nr:ankyrin repeat domain-containing protein [Burkholderiales bacterium]
MTSDNKDDDRVKELLDRHGDSINTDLVLEAAAAYGYTQIVGQMLGNRPPAPVVARTFQIAHGKFGPGHAIANLLKGHLANTLHRAIARNETTTILTLFGCIPPAIDVRRYIFWSMLKANPNVVSFLGSKYGKPIADVALFMEHLRKGNNKELIDLWQSSQAIDRTFAVTLFAFKHPGHGFMSWLITNSPSESVDFSFGVEMAVRLHNIGALGALLDKAPVYTDLQVAVTLTNRGRGDIAERKLTTYILKGIESCVEDDDLETLGKLLNNAPDNMQLLAHAIYFASRSRNDSMVSTLLQRASPAIKNAHDIFEAAINGDQDKVEAILLERSDIDRPLALALIAERGANLNGEITKRVLPDPSSEFNASLLLQAAVLSGDKTILQSALHASPSLSDISKAIERANQEHEEIVDDLKKHVDRILTNAVESNDEAVVKEIVEKFYSGAAPIEFSSIFSCSSLSRVAVNAAVHDYRGVIDILNPEMTDEAQATVSLWSTVLSQQHGVEGAQEEIDELLNESDFDRELALALMITVKNGKDIFQSVLKDAPPDLDFSLAYKAAILLGDHSALEALLTVAQPGENLNFPVYFAREKQLPDMEEMFGNRVKQLLMIKAQEKDSEGIHTLLSHAKRDSNWNMQQVIVSAREENHADAADLLTKCLEEEIRVTAEQGSYDALKNLLKHAPEDEGIDCQRAMVFTAHNKFDDILVEMMRKAQEPTKKAAQLFFAVQNAPAKAEEVESLLKDPELDIGLALALVITLPDPPFAVVDKLLLQAPRRGIDASLALEVCALTDNVPMAQKVLTRRHKKTDFSIALHNAAVDGNEDMVRLLLFSTLPTTNIREIVSDAKDEGHFAIAELLVEHFDAKLTEAAQNGHTTIVTKLLDNPPDDEAIHACDAVGGAAHNGRWLTIDAIFQSTSQYISWDKVDLKVALVVGIKSGHDDAVLTILRNQPTASNKIYALETAALLGRNSLVERLMESHEPDVTCDKALEHASESNNRGIVSTILDHAKKRPNVSNALIKAAEKGHGDIVATLLAYAPEVDSAPALTAAARQGRKEVVEHILQVTPNNISRHESAIYAALHGHDDIADLIAGYADDHVRASWRLRSAMESEEFGEIEEILNDPALHRPLALAIAVEQDFGMEDREVKQILKDLKDGADYALAIEVAVFKGNGEMAMSLLQKAGPDVDLRGAVRNADERGNFLLRFQLLTQQQTDRLTKICPPATFKSPDYNETEVMEQRRSWLKSATGYPSIHLQAIPQLSEAIQFWLPDGMPPEEMQEITARAEEMEKSFQDKAAPLKALLYAMPAMDDFEERGSEYKQRIGRLLQVMIGTNDPDQQQEGGPATVDLSDQEHKDMQEKIRGSVIAECFSHGATLSMNRLPDVLTQMEDVIEFEVAKHYKGIKAHTDYLRKRFGQHTRKNIADLIATEIRLDGFTRYGEIKVGQDYARSTVDRYGWNLSTEIRRLLEAGIGSTDGARNAADKQIETTVEAVAARERPDKYEPESDKGEIIDAMVSMAVEITDELMQGNPMPDELEELINSANETRKADGREELTHGSTALVTLEQFAATRHPHWREFVEKRCPEPFRWVQERIQQLRKDVSKLESEIGLPEKPLDVDSGDWETSEEYTTALKTLRDASPEKAEQLEKLKEELRKEQSEGIPKLVKDLVRQYLTVEPFMTSDKHRWEPKGLPKRKAGANYIVMGVGAEKTCLRIEGSANNSVNLVAIDNTALLAVARGAGEKE